MMSASLMSAVRRGGPPTPLSVFGSGPLLVWLDRSLGITLGTPPEIATWADQGAGGNDASEATNRPDDHADGPDFNGRGRV